MPYLKFISDKKLIDAVGRVVKIIGAAEHDADIKFHKNVIDPFSALFQGVTQAITYKEWIEQEKARQTQKTMQNAIGNFHQEILGSVPGWVNLEVGKGLDVACEQKKIIAEVKNKYNTTKGNHKTEIYKDIKAKLKNADYENFTGYYVEIIPKGNNRYDKPFTPPDNKTKKHLPANEKIRIIDGASFYHLATGRKNALQELFEAISHILVDEFRLKLNKEQALQYFELFKKAFSTE